MTTPPGGGALGRSGVFPAGLTQADSCWGPMELSQGPFPHTCLEMEKHHFLFQAEPPQVTRIPAGVWAQELTRPSPADSGASDLMMAAWDICPGHMVFKRVLCCSPASVTTSTTRVGKRSCPTWVLYLHLDGGMWPLQEKQMTPVTLPPADSHGAQERKGFAHPSSLHC